VLTAATDKFTLRVLVLNKWLINPCRKSVGFPALQFRFVSIPSLSVSSAFRASRR
jgi:hypothetical protein